MQSPRTAFWVAVFVGALAPLLSAAGPPTASEANALAADDVCSAGDGAGCELSLRQLRGEQRNAAVSVHAHGEQDYKEQEPEQPDGFNATEWEPHEGATLGPFCCQNGQGLGYTDPNDIGGSCMSSAKPAVGSFCDSGETCESACNGTWVPGFCALPVNGAYSKCDEARHGAASLRAPQNSSCHSLTGCASCDGTWCSYEKDTAQHAADDAPPDDAPPSAAAGTPGAPALVAEGQEAAGETAGEYFPVHRRRCRQVCRMETWHGGVRRRRCRRRCFL